ncbi:MAG: glycosyltransferase, partial [Candidatus Poseidoniia archaeon]|nr:glycosyltransferase [Candidatus Poseidoniia archaeon]
METLKTEPKQIPHQLPQGMKIPPVRGKGNDYSFIEELKNVFVNSNKKYSLGVSIIVPVYNRKDILAKTLSGIINQTYPSELIETIVADDGSSDGVEELIPEYSKFMDIKHVK